MADDRLCEKCRKRPHAWFTDEGYLATTEVPDRAAFESCSDDGPFDEEAWSTIGHFDPSLPLLVRLARAMVYDTGYAPVEVKSLLGAVRWSKGYVGKIPNKQQVRPCGLRRRGPRPELLR